MDTHLIGTMRPGQERIRGLSWPGLFMIIFHKILTFSTRSVFSPMFVTKRGHFFNMNITYL